MPFFFILYIFLMLYICRSVVWKLCWPGFWWIFAKHTTGVFIFWSIQKYSQFWLPREKKHRDKKHHSLQRENNSTVKIKIKKNLLSLSKFTLSSAHILQTPTSRTADLKAWKHFWHATRETAASGGAENPFLFSFSFFSFFFFFCIRYAHAELPPSLCEPVSLNCWPYKWARRIIVRIGVSGRCKVE